MSDAAQTILLIVVLCWGWFIADSLNEIVKLLKVK